MSNMVTPYEFEHLVSSLTPLEMETAGCEDWVGQAGLIERLSVGAVLQSGTGETEIVARLLVDKDKVKTIIQQIICLEAWRMEIFPRLLKMKNPKSSFPIYSVLFQEACSLSLLETCLFHVDVAENLEDTGTDLLDYCVRNITHLLYPIEEDHSRDQTDEEGEEKKEEDESVMEELLEQVRDLRQTMGLRCLSILRYLTDHVTVLTLGVLARLVTTHDTPGLVAAAIQSQPWLRETQARREVWRDGMWQSSKDSGELPVEKMEFVSWICLYNLLSCRDIMEKYQLNDFRLSVLARIQGRLHDTVVEQLPVLSHLKTWLAQVSISKPPPAKPTLIMELVPQIKESLDQRFAGRWEKIAEAQAEIFLGTEGHLMRKQAERMADTFGLDTMEQLLAKVERRGGEQEMCVVCGARARSRCSRCKKQKYCSKQCQQTHWPHHKPVCKK